MSSTKKMMSLLLLAIVTISGMPSNVSACAVGNAGPGCSPCPIGTWSYAGDVVCTTCPPGFSSPDASVGPDACYPVAAVASLKSFGVTACADITNVVATTTYNGNICSSGAFTSGANTQINGNVAAAGAITLGANSHVTGTLSSGTNVINYGAGSSGAAVASVQQGSRREVHTNALGGTCTKVIVGGGSITCTNTGTSHVAATQTGLGSITITNTFGVVAVTNTGSGSVSLTNTGTGAVAITNTGAGSVSDINSNSGATTITNTGAGSVTAVTAGAAAITITHNGGNAVVYPFAGSSSQQSSQTGCAVGNAGPRCTPCPVGTWSFAGDTACTSCLNGFSAPSASVSPDACYPIAHTTSSTKSIQLKDNEDGTGCAVGNAGPGCSPCPIGSWSYAGDSSCTQCPDGFSAPDASVSPDACYPLPAATASTASLKSVGDATPVAAAAPCADLTNVVVGTTYTGDICSSTSFTSGANTVINGNVAAVKAITTGANSAITGDLNAGTAITLGANSVITGDLHARKTITFGAHSHASGVAVSDSNTVIFGDHSSIGLLSAQVQAGCAVGNAGPGCTACPIGSWSYAGASSCTHCAMGYSCPIASVSPAACYKVSSVTSTLRRLKASLAQ